MQYQDMNLMRAFRNKYLDEEQKMRILEIGSKDEMPEKRELVFRRYFDRPNWEYTGLDITEGRNVDIVSSDLYDYPFKDNEFDLVISANVLEHVEDIYRFVREMSRLTKEWFYLIVPNSVPYHAYPIDCWRIYPDGMKFLIKEIAELNIVDVGIKKSSTYGIGKK